MPSPNFRLALKPKVTARLRNVPESHLERLVDRLFAVPSITIGMAAQHLGVTPAAPSGHIRRLVQAGLLREGTGRRRSRVSVAPAVLTFMRDRPEAEQ